MFYIDCIAILIAAAVAMMMIHHMSQRAYPSRRTHCHDDYATSPVVYIKPHRPSYRHHYHEHSNSMFNHPHRRDIPVGTDHRHTHDDYRPMRHR